MDIDYSSFLHLLSAKSKAQVKTILRLASCTPRPKILAEIQSELEISDKDFNQMLDNLTKLEMLYMRGQSLDFPADFHSNLKSLIESCLDELSSILVRESPQPSLPKFEGLDWRIDIRAGNSSVEKAAKMPKAVLELKIQGKKEIIELSKERVQGLLDVLGKVKEQLDVLADN